MADDTATAPLDRTNGGPKPQAEKEPDPAVFPPDGEKVEQRSVRTTFMTGKAVQRTHSPLDGPCLVLREENVSLSRLILGA